MFRVPRWGLLMVNWSALSAVAAMVSASAGVVAAISALMMARRRWNGNGKNGGNGK